MNNILSDRYFRFSIAAIIYLLIIIWIGNYWLLIGLAILFDVYVTKRVNWAFWKKRNAKNNAFIEWLDALIFAIIAVSLINIFLFQNYKIPTGSMEKSLLIGDHLFVSKIAYGPRMPNTPVAFPFTQHTMPITKGKSWSDIIHWPYKRLAGPGEVKNNDPIVFNFPAGDTVVVENQIPSYYEIVRSTARDLKESSEKIAKFSNITAINPFYAEANESNPSIFPHNANFRWNLDNFGPLWIPSKGATVKIDTSNICLYNRIIDVYENNELRVEGDKIFINNVPADSYTFRMDYYWMMGDNRHRSADSRYWGFVPEDHIVGKPKFIWLSIDKEAKGLKKIRLRRMFMKIK